MKMRNLLIGFLLLVLCGRVAAQSQDDYMGEWYGYITQVPGILSERYVFELDLEMVEDQVTGEARIAFENDTEHFGVMELSGGFWDGALSITELRIKSENMFTFAYWCLKTYDLSAQWVNGNLVMEGDWASDDCGNSLGRIHVERRLS